MAARCLLEKTSKQALRSSFSRDYLRTHGGFLISGGHTQKEIPRDSALVPSFVSDFTAIEKQIITFNKHSTRKRKCDRRSGLRSLIVEVEAIDLT